MITINNFNLKILRRTNQVSSSGEKIMDIVMNLYYIYFAF